VGRIFEPRAKHGEEKEVLASHFPNSARRNR
jgi:hypothetical protein